MEKITRIVQLRNLEVGDVIVKHDVDSNFNNKPLYNDASYDNIKIFKICVNNLDSEILEITNKQENIIFNIVGAYLHNVNIRNLKKDYTQIIDEGKWWINS
jgi:hypothetical protein